MPLCPGLPSASRSCEHSPGHTDHRASARPSPPAPSRAREGRPGQAGWRRPQHPGRQDRQSAWALCRTFLGIGAPVMACFKLLLLSLTRTGNQGAQLERTRLQPPADHPDLCPPAGTTPRGSTPEPRLGRPAGELREGGCRGLGAPMSLAGEMPMENGSKEASWGLGHLPVAPPLEASQSHRKVRGPGAGAGTQI